MSKRTERAKHYTRLAVTALRPSGLVDEILDSFSMLDFIHPSPAMQVARDIILRAGVPDRHADAALIDALDQLRDEGQRKRRA